MDESLFLEKEVIAGHAFWLLQVIFKVTLCRFIF